MLHLPTVLSLDRKLRDEDQWYHHLSILLIAALASAGESHF